MPTSLAFKLQFILVITLHTTVLLAQNTVSIGSEMLNEKAVLMLVSPSGNQGLVLPVVSNKVAVNPTSGEKGMLVYDGSDNKLYLWNGSSWVDLVAGGSVTISSINELDDVNGAGAGPGQVLKWNGTAWAPADDQTGSGTGTDNQELGFNETTKILSITGGNMVDLSSLLGSGGLADDWGAQVAAHDNSLKGDGTSGNPLGLARQTAASGQVLKWNGTNWAPANDNVASGSGGAVNTSPRLTGDGSTTSPLDLAPQAAHEGEVLKWDGSTWKPAADNTGTGGGATYTSGTGINIDGSNIISNTGDSDNDPGNEIQTLAFETATNELSISGGNTITIPAGGTDADADPTNEIQDLSLAGTTINISGGMGVDIGTLIPTGGTDDQTAFEVAFNNVTSGLTSANVQGAIDELAAGSTVDTDDQTLTFDAATNKLGIVDGNIVDLSSLAGGSGTSLWTENGEDVYYNTGNVGIGTDAPMAPLHISKDTEEILRIESLGNENLMNYYNSQGNIGYTRVSNSNVYFGTTTTNVTGNLYLATQGISRITVNSIGNVGIGQNLPQTKLDINGGRWDLTNSEGDFRIGNGVYRLKFGVSLDGGGAGRAHIRAQGGINEMSLGAGNTEVLKIKEDAIVIDGEVNRPSTGDANMLPIAYGQVSSEGNIVRGSNNFSVNRRSAGRYGITIAGDGFSVRYICMATINEVNPKVITVSQVNNVIQIGTFNSREEMSSDHPFYFVIYKP